MTSQTKLTIIMPCYNCENTLAEAVESIFKQGLDIAFEVIMVDDGSTDGTKTLITQLSDKYPQINYVFHEKNRGGGAARNTAVEHSKGELIFCLDSDDILPDNMLSKMIEYLIEKEYDGTVIGKSVFFIDTIANVRNEVVYEEKLLSFEDLFSNVPTSVTGNFLYKREVFDKTGGYPTLHGFDTQGYGFRVMANNFKIGVCKDAYYFQRIPKEKSYYIRELEAGNISKNWFYILSENLYKFSDGTKKMILNYDYKKYGNNTGFENIMQKVSEVEDMFDKAMKDKDYVSAYKRLENSDDALGQYWCGVNALNRLDYNLTTRHFQKVLSLGCVHWSVYHYLLIPLYTLRVQSDYEEIFSDLIYFSPKEKSSMETIKKLLFRVGYKIKRMLRGNQ